MARSNFLEDIILLASRIRWWVAALMALIAYFLLHQLASIQPPQATSTGALSSLIGMTMAKAFGSILQYVVPAAFLIGVAVSYFRRNEREQLHSRAAAGEVSRMSWREFELLVGEAFRRADYEVIETGGGGADGGIDLVLKKDGERHVVQCKHWRAFKVGVAPVRELYGVMTAVGAAGGFVVTSGTFTEQARDFARGRNIELVDGDERGRNIELVDGDELLEIIHTVRGETPCQTKEPPATYHGKPAPRCPNCDAPMVRRTAKTGPNAGTDFLGCSRYPACKGILQW